ncbi:MAG: hypothetical protein LBN05_02830 [Oscillospiraceae bacterium]|jgi:hypothetical protein|nr:hypothetical protein [Oscillospiraceae bacterium]
MSTPRCEVPLILTPQEYHWGYPYVEVKLAHWHWEGDHPYRPETWADLWATPDALNVCLHTYEPQPVAFYSRRDTPVCEDSCLEFFIAPKEGDAHYINVEVNPKGAYLSAIGADREHRTFLKDLTKLAPTVSAGPVMIGETDEQWGWKAKIILPLPLLRALYGKDFTLYDGQKMRGNFYKCGDDTPRPHWGAWSPVTDNPPGFHNPACFGEIVLKLV